MQLDMQDPAHHFLVPSNPTHRRYEALRCLFVERTPLPEAARRFGYAPGSLRNLRSAFLQQPDQPFFLPDSRGRRKPPPGPDRDQRILALRSERNLSAAEIAQHLSAHEQLPVSATTVSRVLQRHGVPKLWRRTADQLAQRALPTPAPVADRRLLDLAPRRFRTDFGGLFLFAADLARLGLDPLLARHHLPSSSMLPAGCAVRSLLALKLWGIGRPSRVMPETLDQGLALFAGLNAVPKRSSLTEYSCRTDPRHGPALMDAFHHAIRTLEPPLGLGQSFDLDFHTIPFHGHDALIQRHYVSKRSRRQKGILAFLARDADSRLFAWADASLRKADQNAAILRFAEAWKDRTGTYPAELVFDSRLTTYACLARLDQLGIDFLTLRRRSPKLVAALLAAPASHWRQVTLSNVGRIYRTPRILERTVRLRGYPQPIRQIAVTDLGHEKPTLLLTNQMDAPVGPLIDRYARRMVIENTIADAIDFFHMDALSAAVPLRVDFDVQLTLMASSLYRLLGLRVGEGFATAKARTIFDKLVRATGHIEITATEIVVSLGRRANNPLLLAAGYADLRETIPWLDNRTLRLRFF